MTIAKLSGIHILQQRLVFAEYRIASAKGTGGGFRVLQKASLMDLGFRVLQKAYVVGLGFCKRHM